MEKKKHKFFWEDEGREDKMTVNNQPARSPSIEIITNRRPMASIFSFSIPRISGGDISAKESGDNVLVTAMFPGFSKEDLKIEISPKHVRIRAESKKSSSNQKQGSFFSMSSVSSMEKSVSLPAEVDRESGKINFSNGILTITLKKAKKKFHLFGK